MAEAKEGKKVSRRDFLKFGGLLGVATQAMAIPALAYKAGSSKETYTGWSRFMGRKPPSFSTANPLNSKVGSKNCMRNTSRSKDPKPAPI